MYGALSYLSNLWNLEEQRGEAYFKVIIRGGNASHKEGDNFNGERLYRLRLARPKVQVKMS